MSEILNIEYNASTEGMVVTLDAVDANGNPYAGKALPTERAVLADMDPTLAIRFRALLTDIHDYFRARVPASTEPDAVVARFAEVARKEEAIARERAQANADAADADKALAAKLKASADLDAEIAAKRAELAAEEA